MTDYNFAWQIKLGVIRNPVNKHNENMGKPPEDPVIYNHISKNPNKLIKFAAEMVYFTERISVNDHSDPFTLSVFDLDYMSQTPSTSLLIWMDAVQFDVVQINELIYKKDPQKVRDNMDQQFLAAMETHKQRIRMIGLQRKNK